MPVSTLSSKGQITLPIALRKALSLHEGDQVDFVAAEGGYKLVVLRRDIRSLRGRFAGRVNKTVSVEQMNMHIADTAARLHLE